LFRIEFAEGVAEDLATLRPFDQRRVLAAIRKQLRHEPAKRTRLRKPLEGTLPEFEGVEPVWQLSVGEYRVFYDVNRGAVRVLVLAVRHKPPHKTTKEIL
jgi:mRNA-degrading endonuclease RelE of RelBE toxin-antitoxin system